ncbi:hypothetical protein ACFYU5_26300 [Nocardia aobensis]|uniref:Uncharacterized protein n=1 Tax=Nocardia aobensis TaxID=257277 RepID=A0ABW6P9U8_9NOCA
MGSAGEHAMALEFPLNGVDCVICARPGLAFVPNLGVKHINGWCEFSNIDRPMLARNRKTELTAAITGLSKSA